MGFHYKFTNEEIEDFTDYNILLRLVVERRTFLNKKTSVLDARLSKIEKKLTSKEDLTRCQIKK